MSKKLIDWYDDYINSRIRVLQNGQIVGLNSLDLYHFCNRFKEKISDLEAKLAVYEKELMDNEKCFTEKDVESLIKDREETIKFLKQQLAELMELSKEKLAQMAECLEFENRHLKIINKALSGKVLIVEDGSVDIDRLEEDGFYVIPYRQGAKPPMWITHQHEDKGDLK